MTIQSRIDFCCQIYSSASPTLLKILDPIQRLGVRLATGAYFTSPTDSVLVEAGIIPLRYKRDIMCKNQIVRLQSIPLHPLIPKIKHPSCLRLYIRKKRIPKPYSIRYYNFTEKYDVWQNKRETQPPWLTSKIHTDLKLRKYLKNDTPPLLFRNEFQSLLHQYNDYQVIYTDGSKNENFTSAACYITEDQSESYLVPNEYSVFSSELFAIFQALQMLKNSQNCKFLLCTDSNSSIEALKNFKLADNAIVNEIRELVSYLESHNTRVIFCWIPGHVGIPGNERVDFLARNSARDELNTTFITAYDLKKINIKSSLQEWEEEWHNVENNKLRTIKTTVRPYTTSTQSTRRYETLLTRLRIGHSEITHSYIREKRPPPVCTECNTPLTVDHLLTRCKKYSNIRTRLNLPNNLPDLLNDDPSKVVKALEFMELTQLINLI